MNPMDPMNDDPMDGGNGKAIDRAGASAATMIGPAPAGAALLCVDQVASLLQIAERSVWRMRDSGAMPAPIKLGKSVRWRADELRKWIERGCPSCRPARLRR